MEFRIEDVTINVSSLGQFGQGEKIIMVHNPTGLNVFQVNDNKLITQVEKQELLKQLELLVLGAEKPKTFAQIDAEYKIRTMERLHRLAGTVLKKDKITEWFSNPHEMLGGKTPFEACFTDDGYDQVENILAGAAYGFPS
jgi:hypothetical protein